MKTVYLLLTRSATLFSRLIRLFTSAPYTHVSISVASDPTAFPRDPAGSFYSFGRKNPYLPFPAGFIRENREGGYFQRFPHTRCVLLAVDVSDGAYASICSRLSKMEICADIYHYNLLGALLGSIGVVYEKRRRYFCSQFVGDLLTRSGAVRLPKPVSLMQPIDYAFLCGVRVLYTGSVGELMDGEPIRTGLLQGA
ncbi:MAG: hypothetical protein IJ480_08660 [Clostridia bacterium]|nr:hypothetical protein [Clostridia bacterium]